MTADEGRALDAALAALPERLRLVLELRFLTTPGWTLKQLGERLGLSYQRVAQLQGRALWLVGWRLRELLHPSPPVAPDAIPALAVRLLALRKQTATKRTERPAGRIGRTGRMGPGTARQAGREEDKPR